MTHQLYVLQKQRWDAQKLKYIYKYDRIGIPMKEKNQSILTKETHVFVNKRGY